MLIFRWKMNKNHSGTYQHFFVFLLSETWKSERSVCPRIFFICSSDEKSWHWVAAWLECPIGHITCLIGFQIYRYLTFSATGSQKYVFPSWNERDSQIAVMLSCIAQFAALLTMHFQQLHFLQSFILHRGVSVVSKDFLYRAQDFWYCTYSAKYFWWYFGPRLYRRKVEMKKVNWIFLS